MSERTGSPRLGHAWLSDARYELSVAKQLPTALPDWQPKTTCFHAQQAAEKALKAALLYAGIPFDEDHDLNYLVRPVRTKPCSP